MTDTSSKQFEELEKIQQAIAAQEALQGILPDEEIETTLTSLRHKAAALATELEELGYPNQDEAVPTITKPPLEPVWGIRLNTRQASYNDYPAWSNRTQREKWNKRGLTLWDEAQQQITYLRGTQALEVLNALHEGDAWRERGITVGEPTTRINLDDPDKPPQVVLTHQISLNAAQTQELLDYLDHHEAELKRLGDQEEKEQRKVLTNVYTILLGDEVMGKLSQLYHKEPETALKLMGELVTKRLGSMSQDKN
jgi:hypothetical protein